MYLYLECCKLRAAQYARLHFMSAFMTDDWEGCLLSRVAEGLVLQQPPVQKCLLSEDFSLSYEDLLKEPCPPRRTLFMLHRALWSEELGKVNGESMAASLGRIQDIAGLLWCTACLNVYEHLQMRLMCSNIPSHPVAFMHRALSTP